MLCKRKEIIMNKVLNEAISIFDDVVEIRRDIHSHPEQGNKEFRTSAIIKEKLSEYGVDEILSPTETGVIGVIKGKKGEGKTVGLRCDMDALPVEEETNLPFSSQVKGEMHACGHDMHMAMMLGNARILCKMRDDFAGTVKLIFEPSEEIQPGGARKIIDSGMVDDVDAFFGLHVNPTKNDVGKICLRKGSTATSADEVYIKVHGKSGHGSTPHKANDAILAACQLNVLLGQIQSRNIDPLETCILTVNVIEGGIKSNVIADTCNLIATIRAYTQETREIAIQKIHDICRGVEKISGCKVEEDIRLGYDAMINDSRLVDIISDYYKKEIGPDFYKKMKEPFGGSEDFSFFSTKTGKPAVLMFLSAGHVKGMPVSTLHSPNCTFDEEAMKYGMAAMTNAALAILEK